MTAYKTARERVGSDTLSSYLKKISRTPLLAREEEQELARKIQQGDQGALHKLVQANLRYVVSVANKYKNCGLPLLDLINEGNIGLIQAAKRFDPERGVKFITYAIWWIRQALMHALAEQSGTVRLPIKQAGVLYKIAEKYQALWNSEGREPSSQDLAREMQMSPEDIESILRVYRNYLSLNAPIGDSEETSYLDQLESKNTPAVDEHLLRASLSHEIEEILAELSSREKEILRMRFGFDGDPMTLEEIGRRLKLSRERIRQIEEKAKLRLRARAKAKTLKDYLN